MSSPVYIWGWGVSGKGAYSLAKKLKSEVLGVIHTQQPCDVEPHLWIKAEFESVFKILPGSTVILSPGIDAENELLVALRAKGIDCIPEFQYGLRHLQGKVLAVTGTNGKSTFCTMLEHVLCENNLEAQAIGNIGKSVCALAAADENKEFWVLELSSYQLEQLQTEALWDYGFVLNITPNHLDRHKNMHNYAAAKLKLLGALKKEGKLWLDSSVLPFLSQQDQGNQVYKEIQRVDQIVVDCNKEKISFECGVQKNQVGKKKFKSHDARHFNLVLEVCQQLGLNEKQIVSSICRYKKLPHRLEFVDNICEIIFINDSKATSVDAVIKAVESLKPLSLHLIVGGKDKGSSYMPWKEVFSGCVRCLYCIGEAAEMIEAQLKGVCPIVRATDLKSAILQAYDSAKKGECVILSPGCSSFDSYDSFEERGNHFKKVALEIKGGAYVNS